MKKIALIIPMVFLFLYGYGQKNIWTTSTPSDAPGQLIQKAFNTQQAPIFELNFDKLQTKLADARQRGDLAKGQDLILEFPTADGKMQRFTVVEASTLHPDLAVKYGNIKSYAGQGIDDPTAAIRFSISQLGFHGMIRSGTASTCFIDPYNTAKSHYVVYARKDISGITEGFSCYTEGDAKPSDTGNPSDKSTDDKKLRKYRLAMSCTAEYGNIFAGSGTDAQKKANILAQMNITMTRVNGVYEQDLAITMEIIPNNDLIIYYGSTSADPWSNEWNNTTQTVIDNAIGDANYDIGHNFNTTGGGNAGCIGCVCQSGNKGSGYTGRSNPTGDAFDIDYVAHEIGHQFGGYHVQSNSSCRSGSGSTEVEPGSGSSIMGYAGICNANVQSNSDDYFNYVNIRDISANVQSGTSSSCAVEINLSNNAPTANAGSNYTIPKSTAFVLRGSGSDPDGNGSLTYCWEQNDPENPNSNSAPPSTRTQGPMFRSIKGTSSPDRYMPSISDVVAGNLTPTWEVVPSVGRNMEFALTVRDNNAGGGQTDDDLMSVTVNGTAGPFIVNAPNTNVTWNVGSSETVTWAVAGTSGSPVNCANVNILLSTDGGFTYPVTILSNTANDGSQVVTVPANVSTTCRVKVEAADNIFYDISNTNFSIEGAVSCTATTPTGLSSSNVGANSATLSWNAVTGATYDVRYRQTGASTWTSINGIAGTSTTISGLSSTTSYEAQVRSVCSGGSTSSYSSSTNFTTTNAQLNYCGSQGNNVSDEYIGRVQLNTIDNSSGAAGYSDHTGISTDLSSGAGYTITVTPTWTGTIYKEGYSVWIDYNQDGDFSDAGEQVWTRAATTATPVSGSFTVPASATLGSTRMRVSMKYNGIPTACETFTYGEVEDYTVNIISAGCPAAGTACNDGDASTFNDIEDGNCNCAGTPCPIAGTSCNDGNASTFNDVEDGNCNCAGTPCPTAGTACNDGNPNTINDVEDGNCNCAGTLCPTAGTACNDGDASTFNDVEDGNCNCAGTPCPTAGTSCDDGDANTTNDIEDGNCNCAGTPITTCEDVTLTLNFDNYPEETTWALTDATGVTIASGGTYPNQPDGSTITPVFCLEDGCYDFTINDSANDGICCGYGNGSYTVTDESGATLASGGDFGSTETTNFCIGGSGCPAAGTACDDGDPNTTNDVEDGNCNCAGTPIGGCTYVEIDNNNFESGWGIWNDGGSDASRHSNYAAYANGTYCVRLRDNTNSSVMSTDNINLAGYEEVTVAFSYYPRSMDNSNEDFWLQVSTNGGSSYSTIEEWNRGDEFENNIRYNDQVVMTGGFTSTTRFRFRCDASSNSDWVYIDDVVISGCVNTSRSENAVTQTETTTTETSIENINEPVTPTEKVADIKLWPNPTSQALNISFNISTADKVQVVITSITGQTVLQKTLQTDTGVYTLNIDTTPFESGIYFFNIITKEGRTSRKFVVVK